MFTFRFVLFSLLACDIIAKLSSGACSFTASSTTPCPGETVTFTVDNPDTSAVYKWDLDGDGAFDDGTGITVKFDYPYSSNPVNYTVRLEQNGVMCATQMINVLAAPDPSIDVVSGETLVGTVIKACGNEASVTIKLKNASSTLSANDVNYFIDWGDGSPVDTATDNFGVTSQPVSHTFFGLGYKKILITAKNKQNGCTYTKEYQYFHGTTPASPGLTPNSSTTGLCAPKTLSFTLTPNPANNHLNNPPGTVYTFKSNGIPIATYDQSNLPTVFTYTFSESSCGHTNQHGDAGAFDLEVSVTNPCGTNGTSYYPIRLSTQPVADFSILGPPTYCPGQEYTFMNTSTNIHEVDANTGSCKDTLNANWEISGVFNQDWKFTTGGFSGFNKIKVLFLKPGKYTIKMTLTPNPICGPAFITKEITIANPPVAGADVLFAPGNTGCVPVSVTMKDLSMYATYAPKWSVTRISPPPSNAGAVIIPDANDPAPVIKFTEAGTYKISLESGNVCGTDSWDTTLVIKDKPGVQLNTLPAICAGEKIVPVPVVTANGCTPAQSDYYWSFSGGDPGTYTGITPPPVLYAAEGIYTYSLTVTNCCGSATATSNLTVYGIPVADADIVFSNPQGCVPQTITFKNLSKHNLVNNWSILPGVGWNGDLNTPSPTITFTMPGKYFIRLDIPAAQCGSVSWDTTINLMAKPSVALKPLPAVCAGDNATPQATYMDNGCPISDYAWSFPGGDPATYKGSSPPAILYATPGDHNYTVMVSNCCGTTTATGTVSVLGIPHAEADILFSDPKGCVAQAITFKNLSSYNPVNIWSVVPNTGWTGNLNVVSPQVNFTAPGTYHISLNLPAGQCGADSWDTTIVLRAKPSASLTPLSPICEGATITPKAAYVENNCAIQNYDWSFPGGMPATHSGPNPPPVTYASPGTFTYSVTVNNCCGSYTATSTVTVVGIPFADADIIFSDTNGCVAQSITFHNRSVNNLQNNWSIIPNSGWNGDLNTASPTINFTASGAYHIILSLPAGLCGSSTWDTTIILRAKPTIVLANVKSICEGGQIFPAATYQENGCPIESYEWSFPGGSPSTYPGPNPPPITYFQKGNYMYTLTTKSCCGVAVNTQFVTVKEYVVASVPERLDLCLGDACVPLNGIPATGCNWTMDGKPVPGNLFCPDQAGIFHLIYTCGPVECRTADTMTIVVHGLPAIDSLPKPFSICVNAPPVHLTALPDNGDTWWTGNGIDSAGWFDPAVPGAGGLMTYHHLDPVTGCENTGTVMVSVNPLIALNLAAQTFCNATQINLEKEFKVTEGPGESCVWSGPGITDAVNGIFKLPANTPLPASFTIAYIYTTAAHCSVSDSVTITIVPLELANAGKDTTVCASGLFQCKGNFGPLTWSGPLQANGPPVSPSGSINLDLVPAGEHTYTYRYTAYQGSTCETSDEINITMIKLAGINAGPDQYRCISEGNVMLPKPVLPPGTSGKWSGAGIVDPDLGKVDVTLIPPGSCATLTYTAVSNTLSACTVSDDIQFCVYDLPVVNFSTISSTCLGTPVAFKNLTTGGATRYCWDFGDKTALICQFEPPPHPYNTGGDYVITLTAWSVSPVDPSDTLCIASRQDTIHVVAPPQAIDFEAVPDNGCADLVVAFINKSIGESLEYQWFKDGVLFSTDAVPDPIKLFQGRSDTTYTITLHVANGCGGGDVSRVIRVKPKPASMFRTDLDTYCSGDKIYLSNNSYGNPQEFRWYKNGELISTDSVPPVLQIFTDTLETVEICLITGNECGYDTLCRYPLVKPTDVHAIFYTDTTQTCVGQPVCFTNLSSVWANVVYDFGDGSGSLEPNPCHSYAKAGEYTVIMKAFGCGYDSFTVLVKVYPLPEPLFSYSGIPCPGNAFQFSNQSAGGKAYLWSFGDGHTSDLDSPVHTFEKAGDYRVCLYASNAFNCEDSVCKIVHIEPDPVAQILLPDSVCAGDTVRFESMVNAGNISCVWRFSDGSSTDGCIAYHAFTESGDYIVVLIVENASGCGDSTSRLIHARPTPEPGFTYKIIEPCAPGAIVQFTDGSTGASALRWYIDNAFAGETAEFEYTFAHGGEHLVTLVASNGGICERQVSQKVKLTDRPRLNFDMKYPCIKASGALLQIEVDVDGNYNAEVSGQNYFKPGTRHDSLADGQYHIYVEADNGCFTDTTLNILAPEELFIGLPPDTSITMGQSIGLPVKTNLGNEKFQWDGPNLSDSTGRNPNVMPYSDTWYYITVTDERGCTKTGQVHIGVLFNIDSSIYVPNVFTPNNDGHNDKFRIRSRYPAVSRVLKFQIFDRWGEMIFEARNYDPKTLSPGADWDGSFRRVELPPASFVWQADVEFVNGTTAHFKGEVLLMR